MSVETGATKSWNNEGVITARTPRPQQSITPPLQRSTTRMLL